MKILLINATLFSYLLFSYPPYISDKNIYVLNGKKLYLGEKSIQ